MQHPEAAARLMRPKPGWKSERAGHGNDDLQWQDACVALGGCDALAYSAFAWVLNGDRQARRQLEPHLLELLQRVGMPPGLDPRELVALALDEQHSPATQRQDKLRALVLGVDAKEWQHRFRRPHAALLSEIESLLGDAWRTIQRRDDEAA
jgi:hypothetical protein